MKLCSGIIALATATVACGAGSAVGQSYPSKPIRLLVAYPPGGSTDINARGLAPKRGDSLGQQVVVDNRPGASGMIATTIRAKAAPDGHTLMMVDTAHSANPALYRTMPYDTLKDFSAISLVTRIPMVLVVHPSLPANSVKDLVALAKSRPGNLNYASAGTGSPMFLVAELCKSATDINVVHIAYKGGGPALAELMGGQIPMLFISVTAGMPQVQAGRGRGLWGNTAPANPARPQPAYHCGKRCAGVRVLSLAGRDSPRRGAALDHHPDQQRYRCSARQGGRKGAPHWPWQRTHRQHACAGVLPMKIGRAHV